MDDLNRQEEFFPERRILAMRRQQQQPAAQPPAPGPQRAMWLAVWFAFALCILTPLSIAIRSTIALHRSEIIVTCYVLAACAVAGAAVGLYRGLRNRQLS